MLQLYLYNVLQDVGWGRIFTPKKQYQYKKIFWVNGHHELDKRYIRHAKYQVTLFTRLFLSHLWF